MISELLLGFFIQSNLNSHPAARPIASVRSTKVNLASSTYSPVPTPTPTLTPKPTSVKQKSSPVVKSAQTSAGKISGQSVLQAFNNYRGKNGVGSLTIDEKLQSYAQSRADHLKSIGKLDKHAGHQEFMAGGGFNKLGFNAIAENQGWNFKGDAIGLIESFYGKSSGHNKNQIDLKYTHVGIGISGAFTNLVFGGRKIQ